MIRRLILVCSLLFLLVAPQASAAGLIVEPSGTVCGVIGGAQKCVPSYTITDFFKQFLVLAWWGLGLMSILAVGMLVWAGVLFITAAGSSKKIDEGRAIITGTITGVLVALTAYVIINTVVAGLTGQKLRVSDYFGGTVAMIFTTNTGADKTVNGKSISRPFSGLGTVDTDSSCQGANVASWDKTCSEDNLHIFCADTKDGPSYVQKYQNALLLFNCTCLGGSTSAPLGNDGCFGSKTLACVRDFQIQNNLPPTGEFDAATRALLDTAGSRTTTAKDCSASYINPIATKLPAIANEPPAGSSGNVRGCCAVGTGTQVDYCVDGVTQMTCESMSTFSGALEPNFEANQNCATAPILRKYCGFCTDDSNRAFQYAGEHWCKDVATQIIGADTAPLIFTAGTCIGRGKASCTTQLVLTLTP